MLIKILNSIKDWWYFRSLNKSFNKEVDENVNMWHNQTGLDYVQEDQDVQQKYTNGLQLMKSRLNSLGGRNALDNFKGNGKNFYVNNDLLSLATDEDAGRKSLRQIKEAAYVYQGADIKTEEDKTKMIDQRIEHYTHLQKDRMARDILKEARAAWSAGDEKLHKQLLAKWEELKYGKLRNNKTRY